MVGTGCGFQPRFQYSIFTTITLPKGFFPAHAKLHSYISKSSQCFMAPVCHCRCSEETCTNRFFLRGSRNRKLFSRDEMGLDSVTQAFQKSTEHFSELEFETVKSAGQGCFVYLHTVYKDLWPFFLESSALACFWCYDYQVAAIIISKIIAFNN